LDELLEENRVEMDEEKILKERRERRKQMQQQVEEINENIEEEVEEIIQKEETKRKGVEIQDEGQESDKHFDMFGDEV